MLHMKVKLVVATRKNVTITKEITGVEHTDNSRCIMENNNGDCQHMSVIFNEIKECNDCLEKSIEHLKSSPSDESLMAFILAKQQELKDFNTANCRNIQMLVQEMMRSNEELIQQFQESIAYVCGGINSNRMLQKRIINYHRRNSWLRHNGAVHTL